MLNKGIQISLAAARVNANFSQDQVARLLKISKNTLVNWEKGNSEPKVDQAIKLSELYRLPLDAIRFEQVKELNEQ